jgi:hypothetical protein
VTGANAWPCRRAADSVIDLAAHPARLLIVKGNEASGGGPQIAAASLPNRPGAIDEFSYGSYHLSSRVPGVAARCGFRASVASTKPCEQP